MSAEIRTDNPVGDILIVDDVPENLRLLMDILRMAGHTARPATGGEVALRSAFAKPPDLILLDIRMPEMDGYEVCHALKSDERTQDVPILFISGLGATLNKIKGFALGAVDYITKPFEVEEVLARVRTHILLRQSLHRLEAQNQELLNVRADLERRVEARTAALKASEAHHRAIMRNASDAIISVDEARRISSWNLAAARLFGWPEEELLGADPIRLIAAAEREAFWMGIRWLLKASDFFGGQKRLEVNAVHASGARVPVEISLSRIEDRDGYVAIIRDLRGV